MIKIVAHTMTYAGEKVTSTLSLLPYKAEYYEAFKEMYDACFLPMRTALGLSPNCCSSSEQLLERANSLFILVEEDKLIGSVGIYDHEIDDLVVVKEHQNRGLGKQLLLYAVAKMQQEETHPITLHVADWNKKAMQLYLNNGFQIIKTEIVN